MNVERSIEIKALIEKVWAYLTEKDKLNKWSLPHDASLKVGKTVTMSTEPQEEWDGKIICKVLEMEPPKRLVHTWKFNLISEETIVTITLSEKDGVTKVHVIHKGFDSLPEPERSAQIVDHGKGWDHHLNLLKNALES